MAKQEIQYPLRKGKHSRQAHVDLPESTYEEEHGRQGFYGNTSHLYHKNRPTDWTRVEGPLKPHALNTNDLKPSDIKDPAGFPLRFLFNDDVALWLSRRNKPMPYTARNADGDEVWFTHRGEGIIETDYGPLAFKKGDYIVIPRGCNYRVIPKTEDNFFLMIESFSEIQWPDKGMLGPHALFDPAVIETPDPNPSGERAGENSCPKDKEWEVKVKRENQWSSIFYPFDPIDTVGWKGNLSPWKLNTNDFRPVMSARYHLPPSVHTTMLAKNFVICTFAPRPLESEDGAMKVPFYHRNIDFDEVLFYHDGDFFSRDGIDAGMLTFHPQGIHHGPHPKAVESSKGKTQTNETAVMVDTYRPLKLSEEALAVSDPDYINSWKD
jgi:homogentisate 1,2-dioxygenase